MSYPGVDDIETIRKRIDFHAGERRNHWNQMLLPSVFPTHYITHKDVWNSKDSRLPKCPTIGD